MYSTDGKSASRKYPTPAPLLFFLGKWIKVSKDQRIKGSTGRRRRRAKATGRRRRRAKDQPAAEGSTRQPKDQHAVASKDQSATNGPRFNDQSATNDQIRPNPAKHFSQKQPIFILIWNVEKYGFRKTSKKEALCIFWKLSYSGKKH